MQEPKTDISLVIVNYNVRYFVKKCLDSVANSELGGLTVETFVVDNASVDGSVDDIAQHYPWVNLIANQDNVGFSKANNQALRKAKGKYLLLLNPDTILEENTLRICFDYCEKYQEVGAVGVKMIDGTGAFLPESKRSVPNLKSALWKLSGLSSLFPKSKFFNYYALGHLDEDSIHKIEVLCGAFMFMRASTIEEVGLLDERFFMYGEDVDLSYRIVQSGAEIHYLPTTTIIHYKGESTKKASLNYVKTFYGAMSLYVEKHYGQQQATAFSKFLKIAIAARASLSAFKRLIMGLLRPLADALLTFVLLLAFAQFWAEYRFDNADYYANSPLKLHLAAYAFIWIFLLWFLGYYAKTSLKKRLFGTTLGLGVILATYGLLPEEWRTSRIIILAGFLLVNVVLLVTRFLSQRLSGAKSTTKKILVVSSKEELPEIQAALDQSAGRYEWLGLVSPDQQTDDISYLNTIDKLAEVTKVLSADEVIFSSRDLTMKEIMRKMMELDSRIQYKIAGDDSLSLIGSNSKNRAGELYTIDTAFNLDDPYYRHVKRSFDFVMSLCLLIFSPVLLFANRFQVGKYFSNCFAVLFGYKTIVGYQGDKEQFKNLPELVKGVLQVSSANATAKASNLDYAKDYKVYDDIEILMKNLNKLS